MAATSTSTHLWPVLLGSSRRSVCHPDTCLQHRSKPWGPSSFRTVQACHICGYEALLVDFPQSFQSYTLRLRRKARCRRGPREIVTFPRNENELEIQKSKYICWNMIEFGPWVKRSRAFSKYDMLDTFRSYLRNNPKYTWSFPVATDLQLEWSWRTNHQSHLQCKKICQVKLLRKQYQKRIQESRVQECSLCSWKGSILFMDLIGVRFELRRTKPQWTWRSFLYCSQLLLVSLYILSLRWLKLLISLFLSIPAACGRFCAS